MAPKLLIKKALKKKKKKKKKKNCAPEFLIPLAFKLPSYGLVVFIDMNTFVFTEDRNFKTFLKENYATASGSCYARYFLKKTLDMKLKMMLMISMEFE